MSRCRYKFQGCPNGKHLQLILDNHIRPSGRNIDFSNEKKQIRTGGPKFNGAHAHSSQVYVIEDAISLKKFSIISM